MPYDAKTIAYAKAKGIAEDELALVVNGCSGGIRWIYALGGRRISCEGCCNQHDIDYQLGGTPAMRQAADLQLRQCTGAVGGWKRARAWAMWAAVRLAGRWYWAGE
ncbi:hypothetical protein [Desulfovibrio cuneatus]|uniref:hypothetical protein n=1 Tax=Desulfovibrio cuneatus TaxID=159728 RepID=UPI00042440A0|nr:hypothetical protein [Desulfovibrio cuneatus]